MGVCAKDYYCINNNYYEKERVGATKVEEVSLLPTMRRCCNPSLYVYYNVVQSYFRESFVYIVCISCVKIVALLSLFLGGR